MRRIKVSEGGVPDPVTGKIVFPPPPAAGVLDPSLMNQFQEEICTVIEAAGITLNESKRDQLLEGIKKANRIAVDTTFNIGTPGFETLPVALDTLSKMHINPGVEVVLQLMIGLNDMEIGYDLFLPQGRQVTIRGVVGNPAARGLHFNGSFPEANNPGIFNIGRGSAIKLESLSLDFNIFGDTVAYSNVRVHSGGWIKMKDCIIHETEGGKGMCGLLVEDQESYVEFDTLKIEDVGGGTVPPGDNIYVSGAALAVRNGATAKGTQLTTYLPPRFSVAVSYGSTMSLSNSTLPAAGIACVHNSYFSGKGLVVYAPQKTAFNVERFGTIELDACTLGSNGTIADVGLSLYWGAKAYLAGCTINKCVTGLTANFDSKILLDECNVTNCGTGIKAFEHSYVFQQETFYSGNTANTNPTVGTTTTDLSRIG